MMKQIKLKFNDLELEAEIFDTKIGNSFLENLPYSVDLTHWGNEIYGSIGIDIGTEKPQPTIPEGGLAYTNQGNYFCIFYGQNPAWPVEYIGQIKNESWKNLLNKKFTQVLVSFL